MEVFEPLHLVEDGDSWVVSFYWNLKYTKLSPHVPWVLKDTYVSF